MTVWMVTVRVGEAGWAVAAAASEPGALWVMTGWVGGAVVGGGGWERMKPATIQRKAETLAPVTPILDASAG